MIVLIDDPVFGLPAADLALYQIIRLGLQERHYIQMEPPFEPGGGRQVHRWIARQHRHIQAAVMQVFENGDHGLTTGPSPQPKQHLCVAAVSEPQWDGEVPVLPVEVACRFLEMPLRLLVENRRNDGAFLRACAPKVLRQRLEQAETDGWIEFVQGGWPERDPTCSA